jgi:hypothetical protein
MWHFALNQSIRRRRRNMINQVDFEGYLTRAWEYREQRSLGVDGNEGVMGAGLHAD